MAGSSSATWQLGVSRMRPPQSFPTFQMDPSPGRQPLQGSGPRCSFSANCSQPSVILMPPISPALTPKPPSSPPQATWVRPLWERLPGGSCTQRTGLTSPTASW